MTDNQHYDHIYPQVADFTFYGGLYRDVRVLTVPKTHFCLDYYGSEGITACSEIKNGNQVQLSLHAYVSNAKETDQVLFSIYDQEGSLQLILIQNFSCLMFICGRVFSHLISTA